MLFRVVGPGRIPAWDGSPYVRLVRESWNDFNRYRTRFNAWFIRGPESETFLGDLKIVKAGQGETPPLDRQFETLRGEGWASLGQDPSYYRRVAALGDIGREILTVLHDIVLRPELIRAVADDPVYERSLLRMADARRAQAEGAAWLQGAPGPAPAPALTFEFACDVGFASEHRCSFDLRSEAGRLGRVMGIVGRSGTGKTRFLDAVGAVLSGRDRTKGTLTPEGTFARVVALSFSPFDSFAGTLLKDMSFIHIGLRGIRHASVDVRRARRQLAISLHHIAARVPLRSRWTRFVERAGVFDGEPGLASPFDATPEAFVARLSTASSGHQLIVHALTGMVQHVRPGTVVLIDEPETHMHPNLLSNFVRILYDFLEEVDAFAVLATHSPVVVQEIPRRWLRVIRVEDRHPTIDTYERESFGENLSEIVEYAFQTQSADQNWVTTLQKLARDEPAAIERLLDEDLSLNARLLLRQFSRRPR
jgi:hypothetical protein